MIEFGFTTATVQGRDIRFWELEALQLLRVFEDSVAGGPSQELAERSLSNEV